MAKCLLGGGRNRVQNEEHYFQKLPPAVVIVFVCFLVFHEGRPDVNFPTPNTHVCGHIGLCLCRQLQMYLELGWNSTLTRGHQFSSSEVKGQYISTIIKSLFIQAISSSPAEATINICSQFLKSLSLKLDRKSSPRPTLILIHHLDSYLNDIASNFPLWIQTSFYPLGREVPYF